ncbi:MAG: hypothetical protein IKX59_00680 [Bacteroidales bacterium]|nr:hypothetical protein [Bacteroidales bacterium]
MNFKISSPKAFRNMLMASIALMMVSCQGGQKVDEAASATTLAELKAGWQQPPQDARPRVWWHWMNGNITHEGIRKDLEWMKRVGLGGFQHFDASLGTPQIVSKRLIYMDEVWKEAFAYAVGLADEMGLEMAVASAPGWSSTGGPWVEPKDAMKKLVWQTMDVDGGCQISRPLPQPDKSTGPTRTGQSGPNQWEVGRYEHYEDVAVIAMRLPNGNEMASEKEVIDITDKTYRNGELNLNWSAPEGRWRIYRFGWSLTGKMNHPAPPEATGLEVDKLDPQAWKRYFIAYLDMYKNASNGLMGERGIQYVLTDSYEAGAQTWTPAMFEEFKQRRGYDLHIWLPVLAGDTVGSAEQSAAFVRDWEKTIGELFKENYDLLTVIAQQDYGMKGRYTEAHEGGRVFIVDGMDLKATAQVPMSAMWCSAPWLPKMPDGDIARSVYQADDRESSSVAHIYGQNIAAAESMTAWEQGSGYNWYPEKLKKIADIELAEGINRFVIHESAHQPVDDKVPGLSLGGIGQWFNRHDTWAEKATAWVDYMSRSCYMLQQGINVADVLVYYGENSNITKEFGGGAPEVPYGYNFDYCNADALCNLISCKGGVLTSSASGTQYRVLWLDRNVEYMSLPVLRKLAELAKAGAVIGGQKPQHPYGLNESHEEFDKLVGEIWSSKHVTSDVALADVLKAEGIAADIELPEEGMKYLHRSMPYAEIYWVNRPTKDAATLDVTFRQTGLKPQLWHPETGVIEEVSYKMNGKNTQVTLNLVKDDAVFVVFCGAGTKEVTVPAKTRETVAQVEGPWVVKFQQGRGAPAEATFETLTSWSEHKDAGIRYFSGTASYQTTVHVASLSDQTRQMLQLGKVRNLAEVKVNGTSAGIVWKEPFEVDVTGLLHEGNNSIEIEVTNLWVNRLIGDAQPNCRKPVTYTDARYYAPDAPLEESGLMGPVVIIKERQVP